MHNRIRLPRRLCMAAVIGLVAFASAARAQWSSIADMSSPRAGHMTASVGTKLYAFSYFANNNYATTAVRYDAATNGPWTALPNMPSAQLLGTAAAVGGKIYLIGGVSVSGSSLSFPGLMTEYDPANNSYTTKATMPRPVWFHASAVLNGKIYVWGGLYRNSSNQNVYNSAILVYDPVANSWTELPGQMPYMGTDMAGASDGTALYSIGGSENTQSGTLYKDVVYRGTVDGGGNLTWTSITPYPDKLDQASAGTMGNKIYVTGGVALRGTTPTASTSTYTYNSGTSTWDPYYPLPAANYGAKDLVSDGTSLYMIGGTAAGAKAYKLTFGVQQPIASPSPGVLIFSVQTGQSGQGQFAVKNEGIAPLTGTTTASASEAWLGLNGNANFTLAPGATENYIVTINATSLTEGNYTSSLTVTSNDPDHATLTIPVKVYVRDELVQQPTRVVLEESSGAWCGPCGAYGVPEVQRLIDKYQEKFIAIALHNTGGRGPTADTLSTTETESLGDALGVSAFPTAAVSRYVFSGQSSPSLDLGNWDGAIQAILDNAPNAAVALDIKSYQWNDQTRTANAVLELTTAVPMTFNGSSLRVTAVMLEDSIRYTQNGQSDPNFHHMHVARDYWPGIEGQEVTIPAEFNDDGVVPPGSKLRVNVAFTPVKFARANKGHIVFMVHVNNGNALGPIIQAEEIGMTERIDSSGNPGGQITYTTPNSTATVVEETPAQLQTNVENGTGAEVNMELTRTANNIPSGWESRFCWNNNCTTLPNQNGPISVTIAPGQSGSMVLKVTPNSAGTGTVTLRMRNTADNTTHDETYTVVATEGTNGVLDVVVSNTLMSVAANTPNPASDLTTFAITLARPTAVSIDVIALDGTTVLQIPASIRDAGTYSQVMNVAGLPAGAYTVRFNAGGMGLVRTLNVVR